ncbi:MAG: PEP-CTERM system TPR-repeat protein PrsT [Thiohalocapsa sp.]|nr:PEP-CTERM system TPR-repeat protein PrsT [Thiohalocapsa sp.]
MIIHSPRRLRRSLRIRAVLFALLCASAAPSVWAGSETLDEAQGAFDKGDYNAAEIELKNLLQSDPNLMDARVLLAQVYLRAGRGAEAEKELRRALDLGADPATLRFDLVEAQLQQQEFQAVLDTLDVAALPAEEQARALALRGRAYVGLRDKDAAKQAFADAVALDPTDREAGSGLVQLALLDGDMETAEAASKRLLEQYPKDPDVMLLRAEVERRAQQPEAAVALFGEVLKLEPENLRALLGRATTLVSMRHFDEARADLKRVDALQPKIVIVSYLRGVMAFYERKWDEAAEHLQRVLSAQPSHVQSQLLMGIVSYARNDLQLAEEYLSRIHDAMPDNLQAAKVLAATRLKLREPKQAVKVLEPLAGGQDPQVMALLGSAYMLAGDQAKGQDWLNRAVEAAPDVAALRTQLALTLIAGGDMNGAIDELQSAVDLGQDVLQADVLLVLAKLKEKRYDEAIAASKALEARQPKSPIAFNLTGLAMLAQGKLDDARARFEKALELDSEFTTAHINLARVEVANKDLDAAEGQYRQVLKQDPKNLAALLGMAALAELRKDDAGILEWLNKAQDANPTATQPGLLLSRYYIDRQEYLKALTTASDLAGRFPDNADALEMLGRAQTLADEPASAIRSYDQILDKNPDDARILYLKGGAQWKSKDLDGARRSFEHAIAQKPDFIEARVALASVLVAAENYDAALKVARGLQTDYPKQALGYRIEGTVQMAARNPAGAIAPLKEALDLAPAPELVRQLAEAYGRAGRNADAIALLQDWSRQQPDDLGTQAMLAMLLHGEGKADQALPIYERLYAAGQKNILILNNLAWILQERGDPRALEIAGNAYELDPNRPEVADTYGWILFNNGQRDKGLRILQNAHLAYPTQTEIAYHTALALSDLGRGNEALPILHRLVREHPHSAQADDAQQLLNKLGGGAG